MVNFREHTRLDALIAKHCYKAGGASVQAHANMLLTAAVNVAGRLGYVPSTYWYVEGLRAAGCELDLARVVAKDAKRSLRSMLNQLGALSDEMTQESVT